MKEHWNGTTWVSGGTTYYRYYKELPNGSGSGGGSSSSSSGSSNPPPEPEAVHLLKYVVNPESFKRLSDDPSVSDPFEASDAIVAQYADYYFEYDEQLRVTTEAIEGGSRSYTSDYAESEFSDGPNSWKWKTVETLPDNSQNIVYTNCAGRTMLRVHKSGTDEWCYFREYDDNYQTILIASPAAISGYDESKADLLDKTGGSYQYLRDSAGLITTYDRHAASGFLSRMSVQEGEQGSSTKLREWEYVLGGGNGSSSSSSSSGASGPVAHKAWFFSKVTEYKDASTPLETTLSYTWYENTAQIEEKTFTWPTVSTDQNGPGTATTSKQYYDAYGNLTWEMNPRGFITRTKYDIPSGAVTQRIQDVDTSIETDGPSGWTTPSGGGLNLVTDFEHDDRGRPTQVLGPSHTIDISGTATTIRRAAWTIYTSDTSGSEVRIGNGYATGSAGSYSYMIVNPVHIAKADLASKPTERIQATRASTTGKLLPSDTFAQSSYTRWTTFQYTDCCHESSQRAYHTIPTTGAGSSGTNYDETKYVYDSMKRRNRTETPGGTITFDVFDVRSQVVETWVGTDDTGATSSDPSGGGATGNNMVQVTGMEYDDGNDGGNGNLTELTRHVDASTTRVTTYEYDYRDRRTDTDGEEDFYEKVTYDNLNRVIKQERYDTADTGSLISRSETNFDNRGRVYQFIRYGVDPSSGTVGNSLTGNNWYDADGNSIKQLPAGSDLFTKTSYDSLGRVTTRYSGYDTDETSYADASSVTDDVIVEQGESEYDAASNRIELRHRQRYHNAPASQTGELKSPSTTPNARVDYSAMYPDSLGRVVATARYGTNGGAALTRSSTIPSGSDTILVTSTDFDTAGNREAMTDADGLVTEYEYDDIGRETKRVMNPTGSSSSSSSAGSVDQNITVHTAYNADGSVESLTADNASTGNQLTQYVYGTTLSDSEVASSLLKRKEIYPDSVDSSDVVLFEYNRLQETTKVTDQGGTVHEFDYDKLGRQTHDRVTALGSGVDGSVRRISTGFEVRGMKEKVTSWDDASVASGNVVNQVQFTYNNFSQLTHDYQAHAGTVNVMSTPNVQYDYASGDDNTIRPTSITYPDGREISFEYDSSGSMPDALSRIASIVDDDGSSTHLADYSYLGLRTFVETDYTEPEVKYTLVGTAGGNDSDTGDIYHGIDRFGRIDDSYWYDYGSSADVDRIKYGYSRSGNRLWRENVVARSLGKYFDEKYVYDAIQRLQDMERGELNGSHTSISNLQFAEEWSLDETGNWSGFKQDSDGDSSWNLEQSRTSNDVNEITDITETTGPSWVTPAYSAGGNMTTMSQPASPTNSYTATYDAWNRLVKIVDGSDTVSEYEYDGAKRRAVQKEYVSGALDLTRHLYYTQPSQWQVIEERTDSSTDANRQFVWGLKHLDELILRDRDTTANGILDERLYGLQDANWNVTSIVNSSGTIQQRFNYDAYGMPEFLTSAFAASTNTKDFEVSYAGYRLEKATTLCHVRNRVLNLSLGCWLQRDSLGYKDGVNVFAYANMNPLSQTDPLGEYVASNPYQTPLPDPTEGLTLLQRLAQLGLLLYKPALLGCIGGGAAAGLLENIFIAIQGGAPNVTDRTGCAVLAGCVLGACAGVVGVSIITTFGTFGAGAGVAAALAALCLLMTAEVCRQCEDRLGCNAKLC
ncbi:MAG: RHS repeat-associated core domain-containing protein [Fuerstiella sp.]